MFSIETRRAKATKKPDDVPSLAVSHYDPDSSDNDPYSSSTDSEYESDVPELNQAAFNNKAKTATGINFPKAKSRLKPSKRSPEALKRVMPGVSDETIKRTLKATTQYATKGAVEGTTLRQQVQAPNPVLNIPRRNEDVATDTVYSSTPAIDDGSTAAQFFIGLISRYRSVHPMGKSDKAFVNSLMDEIRKRGAMNRLISDQAKSQLSARVLDVLRTLAIDDWQSESHQQRQNFSERGYQDTKTMVNNLLNLSGAPPEMWLLALQYVCYLQNHIAYKSLGWRTPMEWFLGYTPDISVLLQFSFYEPVYYTNYDAVFPNDSNERIGRFVGISEHVGHGMTYKVLSDKGKIVSLAVCRPAIGPYRNLRLEPLVEDHEDEMDDDELKFRNQFYKELRRTVDAQKPSVTQPPVKEPVEEVLKSTTGLDESNLPIINITDLLNRTFITNPDEDGEQGRAKIVDVTPTDKLTADGKDIIVKFKCAHGDKVFEEVTSYNRMLEWCDRDLDKDDMFKLDGIVSHRKAKLSTTKGDWEVLVQWATGAKTCNCLL